MISKEIWLVNIGEILPMDGNIPHRMAAWKPMLEENGYKVIFFTTDFEHQRKIWIKKVPSGYIKLKSRIGYKKNISIARLFNHLFVSFSLLNSFKNQPNTPNVIIVSYPTILTSFISVIYGKFRKVKVIVDVRDKWPDIFVSYSIFKLFVWPLYLIKYFIFNHADLVISISPGYYSWSLPKSEIKNDYIIPLTKSNRIQKKRYIDITKKINFIFVGSLGNTYDLEMLILLHDIFVANDLNFEIKVCGDGPRRKWLESQIVGRKNIKLFGWLNKADLENKFDEAHFGLMLYYANSPQGWPNKLIEYMANGLPILNTLNGESWSLIEIEQIGFNFSDQNLQKLVEWLYSLICNESFYAGFVQRNYELHRKEFTEEQNINKLLKLL